MAAEDQFRTGATEARLIGALLLDSAKAWPQVEGVVEPHHFVRAEHRVAFEAVRALMRDRGAADVALVVDYLGDSVEEAGGAAYLVGLFEDCPSAVNSKAYAATVRDAYDRRNVVAIADYHLAKARTDSDTAADSAKAALQALADSKRPTAPIWPPPIDIAALLSTEPAKPRMIVDDWLPSGYATMLAGHGGAGKSSVALHFAACVAMGRGWWGRSTTHRRVVYLSCEDRADILHWRLSRICAREGFDPAELGKRLVIRDLVGVEAILYRDSMDGLIPTLAYAELARVMGEDRSSLLIVDGVSDTYGGNENDRGQVKTFVNALVRLVDADGAVLLVHHVNKQSASASAVTEGYSGSTGWHNSVRARWYLRPELEMAEEGRPARSTGKLLLELQKSNLGRADQNFQLTWDETAHMFVADLDATPYDAALEDTEERAAIMRALRSLIEGGGNVPAAVQGQRTALHVLGAVSGFPEDLKKGPGKRRFWRHVEKLRAMGQISEATIRRADRHFVQVLVPGEPREA